MNHIDSLFTICITVYERSDFFEAALESAVGQSLQSRILVLDNHSSHSLFKEAVKKVNHPNIQYIRNNRNLGMLENMNECLRKAQTPWISILHDDDILHPQFNEMIANTLNTLPSDTGAIATKTDVGATPPEFQSYNTQKLEIYQLKKNFFLYKNFTPFPGVAVNRKIAINAGGFEAKFMPAPDLNLWHKMHLISKLYILDNKLAFYRMSDQMYSSKHAQKMVDHVYDYRISLLNSTNRFKIFKRLLINKSKLELANFYQNALPETKIESQISKRDQLILRIRWVKKILNRIIQIQSLKKIQTS